MRNKNAHKSQTWCSTKNESARSAVRYYTHQRSWLLYKSFSSPSTKSVVPNIDQIFQETSVTNSDTAFLIESALLNGLQPVENWGPRRHPVPQHALRSCFLNLNLTHTVVALVIYGCDDRSFFADSVVLFCIFASAHAVLSLR